MEEELKLECFCFTFGADHRYYRGHDLLSLRNNYVKIVAPDEGEARKLMHCVRGSKWSFCYPEKVFEPQIERWGLTEIDLDDVILEEGDM